MVTNATPSGGAAVTDPAVTVGLPEGPRLSAAETTLQWWVRPYAFLDECAAELGDTFTLDFSRVGTHVVVSHPDDVRDVLMAAAGTMLAGRGNALLEPVLGSHSLLVLDGDRHLAHRMLLQPGFRTERIERYGDLVAAATRRWTGQWRDGDRVSVLQTALEISREVILRAVFGLADADLDRFGRLVADVMALVSTNATFDASAQETPLQARFRDARGALDAALQAEIDRRRRAADVGDDVLGLLVRTDGAVALADGEIRDELVTMVLAGHETTASAIAWALLCLHEAPAALASVREELDAAGIDRPDAALAGLPYLRASCLEALRLRPPIPVVSRWLARPFRVRAGMLPAGTFVTPCAYLAHRRAAVFPDPAAFRPERFRDGRFSPYAYFPFGGGVHRCIGMGLALLEMQIVVGTLLRRFRFLPLGEGPVRAVRRAVTIAPAGGGAMRVARRDPGTFH